MAKSEYEDLFLDWIASEGFDLPERQYRFAPPRRWAFDFGWPDQRVAVEIEGATWAGGRHTRGSGFLKDAEKYEKALQLGWQVYRIPSMWLKDKDRMVLREEILVTLRLLLTGRHAVLE